MTGPSGCGKNTLIDLYCNENSITKVKFEFETESKFFDLELASGMRDQYDSTYPGDVESLIHFITINSRSATTLNNNKKA